MKIKLRTKLLIAFVGAAVIPFITLGIISTVLDKNALEKSITDRLVSNLTIVKESTITYLDTIHSSISLLGGRNTSTEKAITGFVTNPIGKLMKKMLVKRYQPQYQNFLHSYSDVKQLIFVGNVIRKNEITGKIAYASVKIDDYILDSNKKREIDTETIRLIETLGNKYLSKEDNNPIAKAYYQSLSSQKIETLDFQPLHNGQPEAIWVAIPVLPQKGQTAFLPIEDDEGDTPSEQLDSESSGVIIAQIVPDNLNNILQVDSEQDIYLVGNNQQGKSVFHSQGELIDAGTQIPDYLIPALTVNSDVLSLENKHGLSHLVTAIPMSIFGLNWILMTEIEEDEAFSAIKNLMLWIGGIGLCGLVLILTIVWLTTRMIVRPIVKVVAFAHKLKIGDLSVTLAEGGDEIGEMANALNSVVDELKVKTEIAKKIADGDLRVEVKIASDRDDLGHALQNMIRSLNRMVFNITNNAQTLSDSAQKFASVAEQMVDSSQDITAQTDSVTSAMTEISYNIASMASGSEESSANIQSVVASATQMSQNTDHISETVQNMRDSIQNVVDKAQNASQIASKANEMSLAATQSIGELDKSAAEINDVTEIIKEIAQQTNLLALNANIEAASAGEAGKGFSVVANEIKELAKQSTKAAGNIAITISQIQKETGGAVETIKQMADINGTINDASIAINELSEKQMESASSIGNEINEAATGIREIANLISELAETVKDASKNSQELKLGANEISDNISQVNVTTKKSATVIKSIETESTDLTQMADQMKTLVAQFKLSDEKVD